MSDLPLVTSPLENFEQEILKLKRNREQNHQRPHKLVMLLSVIDLMDKGILTENKIYLSEPLITTFRREFHSVKRKNDLCQPGPPFFHLRSSGFWFHKVRPQRQDEYEKLTTTGGGLKLIQKNIEYAYLRDDVFEILQNPEQRARIRLLVSWLIDTSDN